MGQKPGGILMLNQGNGRTPYKDEYMPYWSSIDKISQVRYGIFKCVFHKAQVNIEQYCHGNNVLEINNKLHSLTNGC